MRAGKRAATTTATWNATADHVSGRKFARRSARSLRDEQRAKTTRLAVVLSLFLALVAATLLVGGRAVIDPMLRAAAEKRQASRVGEIVFTMPDGTFCRHLSFDNETAEITEGAVERCTQSSLRAHTRSASGFAWSAR